MLHKYCGKNQKRSIFMVLGPRKNHSDEFKAKVTLAAIKGDKHLMNQNKLDFALV